MFLSVIKRMLAMSRDAWYIFIRSLQLCCLMLFCAFMMMLAYENGGDYKLYKIAMALYEGPQAILFLGTLLSALMEEQKTKR